MKKLVLICGILAGVLSGMDAMSEEDKERFSNIVEAIKQRDERSDEEWEKAKYNCHFNNDKSACQALIDDGLASVEQCTKETGTNNCIFVGGIYNQAGHYREAIPYLEKAIALGDNGAYELLLLGLTYIALNDYFNAKKYFEIGCNKVSYLQSQFCYNLGVMYYNGKGVRQDYHKARELYKKACDMKDAEACNNLGVLYGKGQGVRQNLSIAKQYYGKACDLGQQVGCDNYKLLNNQGVQ
ncbi:tetratricopeptide repeat protein [Helicobacter sp. 23-1048]